MSAENFINQYQGKEGAMRLVEAKRGLNNNEPPVIFLANRLIAEARQGLLNEDKKLDIVYREKANPEREDLLIRNAQEDFRNVFFGNMVTALSDTEETGTYDHNMFVSTVNNAFTGTAITSYKTSRTETKETINPQKRNNLTLSRKMDSSFATAISNRDALPDLLKKFFYSHAQLYLSLTEFAPTWKSIYGEFLNLYKIDESARNMKESAGNSKNSLEQFGNEELEALKRLRLKFENPKSRS